MESVVVSIRRQQSSQTVYENDRQEKQVSWNRKRPIVPGVSSGSVVIGKFRKPCCRVSQNRDIDRNITNPVHPILRLAKTHGVCQYWPTQRRKSRRASRDRFRRKTHRFALAKNLNKARRSRERDRVVARFVGERRRRRGHADAVWL